VLQCVVGSMKPTRSRCGPVLLTAAKSFAHWPVSHDDAETAWLTIGPVSPHASGADFATQRQQRQAAFPFNLTETLAGVLSSATSSDHVP
jgi:hypothetical protein